VKVDAKDETNTPSLFAMRVPNCMARFCSVAAFTRPSRAAASRSSRLSPHAPAGRLKSQMNSEGKCLSSATTRSSKNLRQQKQNVATTKKRKEIVCEKTFDR
jgi:hypothetical protein